MNNNINYRFYTELFKHKKVSFAQDSYNCLYKTIWPCENYFVEFLNSSDFSKKLVYAKKSICIFKTLVMFSCLPFFSKM